MSKLTAHLLMLIAAFIWGTTFVAQTTGMDTIGPITFTTARYFIGAIVLLPLAFYERRKLDPMVHLREDGRLRLQVLGLGVMMFGGIALQQTALLYAGGQCSLSDRTFYVPAVPIFLWLILRQPVARRIWLALLLSLVGSWLLSEPPACSASGVIFWWLSGRCSGPDISF